MIICVLHGLDGGSAGAAAVPTCLGASNPAHVKNTMFANGCVFVAKGTRWFSKRERVYAPIESLRLRKLSIKHDLERLRQLHASGSSAADPSALTRKPPRCSCSSCREWMGK